MSLCAANIGVGQLQDVLTVCVFLILVSHYTVLYQGKGGALGQFLDGSIRRMSHPTVNIFILCFNESILLPHTVNHYRKILPDCKITIYDNESTDDSVKIAKDLGCKVISWSSNGINNVILKKKISNNCWKSVKNGWVIMIDMDEWLCITEADLNREKASGTTILNVVGYDMVGKSKEANLSDINLERISKGLPNKWESKHLCFLRPDIKEMNYNPGAHKSDPKGNVKYSNKSYINKHMSSLGLPFLVNKMKQRFKRSHKMQTMGMSGHYTNNTRKIRAKYKNQTKKARKI